MFSVMLSIVAETMKLSVNSSVLLLTRYDTDFLAFSKLSFRSFSTLIAVSNNILTENEDDNNMINMKNNNIILNLHIKYSIYNIRLETKQVHNTNNIPDILFLNPINRPLKKFIIDPIMTTG